MKHDRIGSGKRKSVNLSIDTGIIAAARAAGLNLSQISEASLRKAIGDAHEKQWREEHRAAIEANNEWVERNGLPLAKYRLV
jgi:antitoxin CcdA